MSTRSLLIIIAKRSSCLFPAFLLVGCVMTPKTFRVASAGSNIEALSPESFIASPGRVSVIYWLDNGGRGCPKDIKIGQLSVKRAAIRRRGVTRSAAMVFTLPDTYVSDDNSLTKALAAFWDNGSSFRKCYGLDGDVHRERLFRWVRLHRPLSPVALLDEAFGIPANDLHDLRTVQLRAGMRLCASDVVNDSRSRGAWVAMGESCTRVVNGLKGGVGLDATTARFASLNSPVPAYRVFYKVASWGEVASPNSDPLLLFVVYPRSLPTKWTVTPPAPIRQPILVGVKLAFDTNIGAIADLLRPPPGVPSDSADRRLDTLCQMPDAICYQFGERGMINVSIPVVLNGSPLDLPVGATLADVAAMMRPDISSPNTLTARKLATDDKDANRQELTRSIKRLRMYRSLDGALRRVDLSKAGAMVGSLPLLPGDRLAW